MSKEVVSRWRLLLTVGAVILILGNLLREMIGGGTPTLNTDSALYMHGGWWMTQGGIPYVDFWQVKAPLAFEIPALLSLLTGGDPFWLYILSVVVSGLATVGLILAVGTVAGEVTDSEWASLLAGGALFTMPPMFWYPALGFSPKAVVLCLGFAAVLFALRDRPYIAGIASAAAAGIWQLSVIFVGIVLGISVVRGGLKRAGKIVATAVTVAVVVVTPVVVMGGGKAMLVEVVFIPLTGSDSGPITFRILKGASLLGVATITVAVGVWEVSHIVRQGWSDAWWLVAGLGFGLLQMLVDLDYFPDTFLALCFAAIGVGTAAARFRPDLRLAFGGILAVLVVLNVTLLIGVGPFGPAHQPIGTAKATYDSLPGGDYDPGPSAIQSVERFYDGSQGEYLNDLYWDQRTPPYCHYRFGAPEANWLRDTRRTYASPCGELPSNWRELLF
jgi:hypothetical protein